MVNMFWCCHEIKMLLRRAAYTIYTYVLILLCTCILNCFLCVTWFKLLSQQIARSRRKKVIKQPIVVLTIIFPADKHWKRGVFLRSYSFIDYLSLGKNWSGHNSNFPIEPVICLAKLIGNARRTSKGCMTLTRSRQYV